MSIINVHFKNKPVLQLLIESSMVGQSYYNLVKQVYEKEKPIYRDANRYTEDYMHSLALQVRDILGWNWITDNYNAKNAIRFHKDIEVLLQNGFDNVPAEFDEVLHEIHYGLHISEWDRSNHGGWLQIEWYNDEGIDLDSSFKFKKTMSVGDVKLQNPYVGHGPTQIYTEQDNINISQTCKFHDLIRPGINISTANYEQLDEESVIEFFKKYDSKFVNLHGEEKIKNNIGYPVIGNVVNLDDLEYCLQDKNMLELEKLTFEDYE